MRAKKARASFFLLFFGLLMLASCSRWNQPSTVLDDEIPATATFGKSFRNFIFIGEDRANAVANFNLPTDLEYIESHDYVFLAKFHGDGDRNWQHEAAKAIKSVPGPDPKVFPYIAMKVRLDKENKNEIPNFNSEVKLRSGATVTTLTPEEDPYNMEFNDAWYLTVRDNRVIDDYDNNPNTPPSGDPDNTDPDRIPYEPAQANNPNGYIINLIPNVTYNGVNCNSIPETNSIGEVIFEYRSNLPYHQWIRGVISDWMAKTGTSSNGATFNLYDGIYFDASSYIGLGNDRPLVRPPPEGVSYPGLREQEKWKKWLDGVTFPDPTPDPTPIYDKLIGSETVSGTNIRCLNRGIEVLLNQTKTMLASSGREVVWNGFAETDRTPDSRSIGWGSSPSSLGLQSFANGSLNEFFCVTPYLRQNGSPEFHSPQKQLEEIEILYQRSALGKIFEKVNYKMPDPASPDVLKAANFCLGVFAMGINKDAVRNTYDNAYFAFSSQYKTSVAGWNYSYNRPDFKINLAYGNPYGNQKYKIVTGTEANPGILARVFQGGFVVVNLKSDSDEPLGKDLCTLFNLPPSCTTATPQTVILRQSAQFFDRTDVN